ncbi:hypothetical protein K469DRAFT_596018, partial [Zopfia rhizophila CBS 207.26]
YVHKHSIRHADLGSRNVLLDLLRTVLLYDFAGSAINNKSSIVWAESGFKYPDDDKNKYIMIQAELYALGLMIYEIITSSQPYGKIKKWIIH